MNRTYNHRIMFMEWSAIALFALGALYGLWNRQNSVLVLLGVGFVLLVILALERALHTTYVTTTDHKLIIKRGRFAKQQTIVLADIRDVRILPLAFRLGNYVLIELKTGRVLSVQPENQDLFIKTISKKND